MRPVAATLLVVVLTSVVQQPVRAQEAPTRAQHAPLRGVGISLSAERAADVATRLAEQADPAARPILAIWAQPDESGSITSATAIDAALRASQDRARMILGLGGMAGQSLDTRLASARALTSITRGRAAAIEIGEAAICGGGVATEAFTLKKIVLALREQEPDIPIALAIGSGRGGACPSGEGGVAAETGAFGVQDLAALWPFLDALAEEGSPAAALSSSLALEPPPGLPRWAHRGASAGTPWERLLAARFDAAPVTTAQANDDAVADWARALDALARAIPPDAEAIRDGGPALTWPEGASVEAMAHVVPSDLSSRLVFGPAPPDLRSRAAFAVVRLSDRVASPRLIDPSGKLDGPVEWRSEAGGVSALQLPLADRPLVLAWDRASSADEISSDIAVAAVQDPTLEEILARHAARAAFRDGQVSSWSADLTTTMRYSLGGSGRSIDVRVEGRYYEREGLREIENLRYFIDGSPYRSKDGRPPELPLMQPDKVTVVPLDVHLDKSYQYELRGRGEQGGRAAWRVAFKPLSAKKDAWSGLAWIDAGSYDLLATDVTQTGLEAPILANQQQERRGPVAIASGDGSSATAWLVREIDVQRTLSLIGSNVVVDMRLEFSNPVVNDPTFEERLEEARASDRQMLRETDDGLKYLKKDETGQRVPVDAGTRKLFFLAGMRFDDSLGPGVIPLGGVNILEANAWNEGLQVNAFLAGAINSLSISDPSVAGSKTGLTFDGFLPLVRQVDRLRGPDGEDEDTEARVREPRVGIAVTRPLGANVQAGLEARVAHQSWSETDETVGTFQVPENTWLSSLIATTEIHAKGFSGRFGVERSHRSSWEAWGPEDALGEPTVESPESYWKWRATIGHDFRLTSLQTFGVEAEYLGSDDLDRFSQYEFAAFGGPQLPGFEGSGLHFDEAAILRTRWSFSAFGRLGFDVKLAAARTRNELLSPAEVAEIGFEGTQVGLGLGATFPGPWRTIVRVEIGTALSSPDHDDLAGDVTGQFVFTKLLK